MFQQDPAADKPEEGAVVGPWNVLVKYLKHGLPRNGKPGALIVQPGANSRAKIPPNTHQIRDSPSPTDYGRGP